MFDTCVDKVYIRRSVKQVTPVAAWAVFSAGNTQKFLPTDVITAVLFGTASLTALILLCLPALYLWLNLFWILLKGSDHVYNLHTSDFTQKLRSAWKTRTVFLAALMFPMYCVYTRVLYR